MKNITIFVDNNSEKKLEDDIIIYDKLVFNYYGNNTNSEVIVYFCIIG